MEKVIVSPQVAAFLVNEGARIIRLKADRANPIKSVFVFQIDEVFNAAREKYKNIYKK